MALAESIAYLSAFVVISVGSYTDMKTREVPDFVNYGLIGFGITLNIIFSVAYSSASYIVNSLLGFIAFFLVALLMFYTGQWGGGDSKMLMGLGALIGLNLDAVMSLDFGNIFLLSFFVNVLLAGAFYGLTYTVFLAVKNRKAFSEEYKKISFSKWLIRGKIAFLAISIFVAAFAFYPGDFQLKLIVFSMFFVLLLGFYMGIFVKAVEKACMYKLVKPSKLTEGDWIAKDIMVRGKYIAGPKDLGIEKEQIKTLIKLYREKKVREVLVKEGIPFVPSFFLAFTATLFFGNIVLRLF